MILRSLLFIFIISFGITSFAQFNGTLVLVRHAEKEAEGKDPTLTTKGQERAENLAFILGGLKVTDVLSTNYNRTKETVLPLANKNKLELTVYPPVDFSKIEELLSKKNHDAVVVVAGHSNTIPAIYNHFTGNNIPDFKESEYDNLIIVTFSSETPPKTIWLHY